MKTNRIVKLIMNLVFAAWITLLYHEYNKDILLFEDNAMRILFVLAIQVVVNSIINCFDDNKPVNN